MEEFVTTLIRMLISLVGVQSTRSLVLRIFPGGELSFNERGVFVAQDNLSDRNAQKLVLAIGEYTTQNFGQEFTENLLSRSYATLKQDARNPFQLVRVLNLIPKGFLEEEKIKVMSREELEARVLERTKELEELNKTLENRIIQRTKELAQANKELEQKNKTLENLSKAKTEFVSLVSHQLLTPLSSSHMALYELADTLKKSQSKETRHLIENMIGANERLIRLIENLLNIARIEEGRLVYTFQNTLIDKVIREIIENLTPKAKEKNLTIEYAETPGLPFVKADKEKFYLVIENLIANAIKYSSPKKTIQIKTFLKDHSLFIRVQDAGIGIPQEDQEKIFQKFFRAQNATQQEQGTGLGLFIAKQIIESHGGTISFESKEQEGTTFTVQIPVSTPAQASQKTNQLNLNH